MHRGRAAFRYGVSNLFGSENDRLLGSPYVSGRSRHWVKSKNPAAPAVKREAEEELRKFPPSGFENQKMLEWLAEDLEQNETTKRPKERASASAAKPYSEQLLT